ncbi:hypothetical protein ElyMa_006116800 [Elysia marginata]|uniref:Uncharacterized protein n=1 Tax=Elysia marginata TaxID=1093978 RepID=A0AAV4GV47_9GAST|nr:hypothetical protein ElyMa_006116800 [Elysia marginata]
MALLNLRCVPQRLHQNVAAGRTVDFVRHGSAREDEAHIGRIPRRLMGYNLVCFVRSSPFSAGGGSLMAGGTGVFGDMGLTRSARSAGFRPESDAFFNGRSSSNRNLYTRPIAAGFGNPPQVRRYGEEMSAFRNLFGQDIGQSAGIYDSFGKPKQGNLALIAQSRPAGRLRLDESTQNSALDDMERYRKHPFSSIRLSPVSQISGVQVQTPFGNHQRDGNPRDDNKDFFVENRARRFHRKDPFERPISRSNFPLPPVNGDITLELPINANSPARQRNVYQPKQSDREKHSFEEPTKSNRNSFSEPEFPIATAPADAFVWAKPIAVPQVGPNNSSKDTIPDKKASLINVSPGDSLSFPKTKALKLPDLPSESEKANSMQVTNNASINQVKPKGHSAANDKVINLADLISTVGDSSIESLENSHSTSAEESKFIEHLKNPEKKSDSQHPQKHTPEVKTKNSISPAVASPENVLDPKTNNKGRYDVTTFKDEAITKKNGDIPLLQSAEADRLSPNDDKFEISPFDLPAIKTVVERTIEDGSETIVKNKRRLETDDSGFILTNDLYSDEANLEGITETDTVPYTGRASHRLENEMYDHTSQQQPTVHHKVRNNPSILDESQSDPNIAAEAQKSTGKLLKESPLTLSKNAPTFQSFDTDHNTPFVDSPRTVGETTGKGHSGSGIHVDTPPIGSGYLLSNVYFDEDEPEPPPPPPLVPPSTSMKLEEDTLGSLQDKSRHATGTSKISSSDTIDVLSVNEEKLKEMLQEEATPRLDIQTVSGPQMDEKEFLTNSDIRSFEGGLGEDRDNSISSSNTVIDEEHIGLEHLKRMKEEAKRGKPNADSIPKLRTENGQNGFKEKNFDSSNDHPKPFELDINGLRGGSGGLGNTDDSKGTETLDRERKRKPAAFLDEDFTINTNPASANFDLIDAGEGTLDYHHKYDLKSPPRDDLKEQDLQHNPSLGGSKLHHSDEDLDEDHGSEETGQLEGDLTSHSHDALPDDFINVGLNDIRKPMADLEGQDEDKRAKQIDGGEAEGTEEPEHERRKGSDNDIFEEDFVDYSNYEDPYYGYDYYPDSADDKTEPRQSSAFLETPFQSMFGKTADQSRRGSFGSLFQNLGQPQRSRGGANNGGGWGLFDDKLGQIIKTRPSLNLFNG